MKRLFRAVVFSLVAMGLAACTTTTSRPVTPIILPPQNFTVDGQWADSAGISTSSFRNGIFETRSSDTFEKLSEGNYVMRSGNLVEIEMRSLVRGTVSRVNCALNAPAQTGQEQQLMCTTQGGSQFTLTRQSERPGAMSAQANL